MKNMKKKLILKCFVMILLTLNASLRSVPVSIFAATDNNLQENKQQNKELLINTSESFAEDREQYKFTNKKINKEIKHQSGSVNTKLEKHLNENGVFDDEINTLGEKNLNDMEQCDIQNVQIYAGYYAMEDTKEREGQTISEDELIPLTAEEVNKLIGEEYYEDEISKDNIGSSSSTFLKTIGIETIAASAKTESRGGIDDKKEYTLLKKILIVYQCRNNPYYCVTYSCIWTKMPKYTNLDVVSLKWDGAFFERDDFSIKETSVMQKWTEESYDYVNGTKYIKLNRKIVEKTKNLSYHANPNNLKAGQYFIDATSICCAVQLHKKKETTNLFAPDESLMSQRTYKVKECYNESVVMVTYIKRETNRNIMTLYPYYLHSKTNLDLSIVAINIATKGYLSAIYNLVSGKTVSIETEYSGVTWPFTYNYNTYK